MNKDTDQLLKEDRIFKPSAEFQNQAKVKDDSIYQTDRLLYWEQEAKKLDWFKSWDKLHEWDAPYAKWFLGGKLNVSYNCLDRHVKNGKADRVAFYWEGENGDEDVITYQQAYDAVNKFANGLKKLGVAKGDRVAIYMPMVPEAAYAMLACSRIGAVHTVVFGGFSVESLQDRINDAQAKVLITADGGYRRGSIVPLKDTSDQAVQACPSIEHMIVIKRTENDVTMQDGRDVWYGDLIADVDDFCEPEQMDAEDLLFILYTSGTTGKPKGIMHTTGGYLTGANTTCEYVFDLKDSDVFWCTADVGWITGHSYIVYGPMANAATQVVYEGAPDFPERNRFWKLIEKYKVSIFYTAPTAIRAFMKWGTDWPKGCDLSSLRLLGSVGEPINPEAWMWYYEHIGNNSCPIVDTWWQTETGSIMISALPGACDLKPGSATRPMPGIEVAILDENGRELEQGQSGGFLSIKSAWPSMMRGIWGNPERYKDTYWSKWDDNTYFPGDGAVIDNDGFYWLLGRVDDVMSIAGHNIGTAEVESALVDHKSVAEAAVVGVKDELKGQAIAAFVILKEGNEANDAIQEELKSHVASKIGSIAKPKQIIFTSDVPKTRSGKIMRRLLRDIAEGRTLGDVTTLADPSVVESLKSQYKE